MTDITSSTPLQLTVHPLPQSTSASNPANQFLSGGDAPSFKDFLDTINPLQHIPIVSTIYQKLTGDVPSSGANIAGGALYGGPLGLASAVFNTMVQQQTGSTIADNILDAIQGKQMPAMQVSSNDPTSSMPMGNKQQAAYNAYVHASMLA